ncbi:MAG TPA: DMT family transporter [Steroidobacteraceae bacterium]
MSLAWLQIHFCVLLWGFTAILGKLITLPALAIVWWRTLLVSVALALVARFWRAIAQMPRRLMGIFAGIGTIVALHWVTFYGSIKTANASVAATCMALIPILIAFVEPFIAKRRFDARELLFGLAVLPGVALVVGGTPTEMRLGIAIGALSALLAAVFGSLNKLFVERADALAITGIEMAAGTVLMTVVVLLVPDFELALPRGRDAVYLLALALGCTLLPFALSLVALRKLSTFSTALAVNMEPVYAILLAIVLLGEQHELEPRFYIGVAIILAVVFGHPWLQRAKPADSVA